jgi:hypothetical protein
MVIFKYRNFLSGLLWPIPSNNPLYWKSAFLPLGISFFTFEFIHYAVDRYRNKTVEGTLDEYLAFILFFPTMVAGPIKRYQNFLPTLRSISPDWALDWQRGFTRILAGLVKKFANRRPFDCVYEPSQLGGHQPRGSGNPATLAVGLRHQTLISCGWASTFAGAARNRSCPRLAVRAASCFESSAISRSRCC